MLFAIRLDADELEMGISVCLLDQSFHNCAHDLGFLQADFQDFLMIDSRLRWILDDIPFELNGAHKRGEHDLLNSEGIGDDTSARTSALMLL